jgi:alkylation response protein AidB-like acyl-CoA dehydrogenase
MVLVPRDTPGLEIIRHLPVFGYQDQHGHSELRFTDVRVPVSNILSGEGDGFMIAQARLYVLKTADLIDKYGAKGARTEISAIKVAAPKVALDVIDRAIQVHGGAGVSNDTVLARFYASARTLRIVDGPDAVHIRGVAKEELARERPYSG